MKEETPTREPAWWRRVLLVVAVVQLGSAAAFLIAVAHPVFDEQFYDADVSRYQRDGITLATLRAHVNAAGPGMPILAALGGRLHPGSVAARRVPVFLTWVAAVVLLAALARQRPGDAAVPAAGAMLLVFPHSPISMATLLTEGPAVASVLAALWASDLAAARPRATAARAAIAGACLGLALLCRQYYLAIVPAFALGWWRHPARWRLWAALAVGPIAVLAAYFAVWGGLTSVSARTGASFGGLQSSVSLNLLRPLSALAYVGAYALPLLPWGDARRLPRRRVALLAAASFVAAAIIVVVAHRSVWGNGPLLSLVGATRRVHPLAERAADLVLTTAAFTGVLALGGVAAARPAGADDPFALVSAAVVVLFALEQAGVGGNVPYFERYAHQTIFFASALALLGPASLSQSQSGGDGRPRRAPVVFVVFLLIVGQGMLWRYARQ